MKRFKSYFWLAALLITGVLHAEPIYRCSHHPTPPTTFPHDTRSDSIDILNYEINLDITDFTNRIIDGYTEIQFTPLVNGITEVHLDLMTLTVDSVVWIADGSSLSFTHTGEALDITFPSTQNATDTASLRVYYQGTPSFDPTFGGFYFQSGFAYSVGVSLNDIPHNYGRTWFPCFDNFTERSTYDLIITTQDIHTAVCSGLLINSVDNGNGTNTFTWRVNQTIPTYLPSVAVNNLVYVQDTFMSITNTIIPIRLAARPSDTVNMKNSFVNLKAAIHIYEDKFGPYLWDRVGYVLVPMTAGAMEHAMNIAYPILLANGSLTYQDIMVHELAHAWWGNLVTCRTAEDMWINEGSAVYCEYVFNEVFYGPNQYRSLVRNAHKTLIHRAHIDDDDYWPLSGVPQSNTYGLTTYTKGADMIHTLRAYLGDTLFFNGLEQLLTQNAFEDIDAEEYRDDLSAITSVNLNDYFEDWIFQGGWPHVSIDSMQVTPSGPNYDVQVHFKQKLVGRSNYSNNVPFTLTFMDAAWNVHEVQVYTSGATDVQSVTIPINPVFVALNLDEKISHAVTAEGLTINSTGAYNMTHANMNMNVLGITDSVYFLVEHNWAAADPLIDWTKGYTVSPQRYWRVSGIWNSGFNASATISYNGRTTGSTGHLDHLLITSTEDSLVLLYRPGPGHDWEEYDDYTLNMSNPTDKVGSVSINTLIQGEYTLGLKGLSIGLEEEGKSHFKVFPNPTRDNWKIELVNQSIKSPGFQLYNAEGKLVYHIDDLTGSEFNIPAMPYPSGIYFLCLYDGNQLIATQKIVRNE